MRKAAGLVGLALCLVVSCLLLAVIPATSAQAPGSIWKVLAPSPESFSEIAVAELNGKLYVVGGYPVSRRYVDTVQVYDAAADRWSYATPAPQPLHHTVVKSANGKLYLIGGEISDSGLANQGYFINLTYEYDPATSTWRRKANMPTARGGGAAAVVDGKIYVAGGRPPAGADFAVYDTGNDTWTTLPNLPTPRNHLAVTAIGGKIYAAGGRFGAGVGSEMTDVLEIYDPATNTWTRGARMLEPRAGLNGVTARGCFYTFGGEGNDAHPLGVFANNEVYNPATDSWQRLEPLPVPVHGVTGSGYINGWIHLPSGGLSRGGISGSTLHQAFRAEVECG